MAVGSAVRRQKSTSIVTSSQPIPSSADAEDVELERKSSSYDDQSEWSPRPYTIFKLLLSARLCSAFLSNLSDCDETFNYWEPMHYLMFGSGFQTWEYSPKYAIRSYAYVLLHTIPGKLQIHLFEANKILVFYFLRFVLSIICAACETYFYRGIMKQFGNHVARITIVFMLFSTGMFISAAAFLPSSFAMYMVLLSYGGWFAGNNAVAVMATAAGALIGWPFSAILGLPIAWDILVRQRKRMYFVELCLISLILFLGPLMYIDSFYYGKTVIAPLNIVLYNVFGKGGPSLYGVEPWTFYFLNGVLNFNVVFPLALLSLPACVFVKLVNIQTPSKKFPSSVLPVWLTLSGMYIWVVIFFTRPHKVCAASQKKSLAGLDSTQNDGVNAVSTLEEITSTLHQYGGKIPVPNLSFFLSLWGCDCYRSTNQVHYFTELLVSRRPETRVYTYSIQTDRYHAPLDLYVEFNHMSSNLEHPFQADRYINLCIGKEWYRYPSSFFLPSDRWRLQFIRSEFRGQLPKPYSDAANATKMIPTNMNDMNKEEPSRYISVSKCDFLVDLATGRETVREPNFERRFKEWELVIKKPFLDAERSHRILRAFYIPFLSSRYTTYVNYVLLRSLKRGKAKSKGGK